MSAESAFRRFVCFQGFNLVFLSRFFTACAISTQKGLSPGDRGCLPWRSRKARAFSAFTLSEHPIRDFFKREVFFSLLGLAIVTFFGCASELLSSWAGLSRPSTRRYPKDQCDIPFAASKGSLGQSFPSLATRMWSFDAPNRWTAGTSPAMTPSKPPLVSPPIQNSPPQRTIAIRAFFEPRAIRSNRQSSRCCGLLGFPFRSRFKAAFGRQSWV
jgi:hypothetical protein